MTTKRLFDQTVLNLQKALDTEKKASMIQEQQDKLEIARLQRVKAELSLKLAHAKKMTHEKQMAREEVFAELIRKREHCSKMQEETQLLKASRAELQTKRGQLTERSAELAEEQD